MAPPPSRTRKRLITVVKLLVIVALFWGLQRTIRSALADLSEQHWRFADLNVAWLAVCGLAYLAGQVPSSLFWHRLLQTFAQPSTRWMTIRAWFIGSLGKYVPGKTMVILLRTALLRSEHVGIAVSTATIFYETLTTMAVGAFVAGAILIVVLRDQWQMVALAAALMVVAGAPTVPAIFKRIARLAGIERAAPAMIDRLDHLGRGRLARAWVEIAFGWWLIGLSVWAALRAVGHEPSGSPSREIALATATGALAIVAGFVSFIPGGLVVRDAVILEVLAPTVGAGPALVCALVARLVWLLSEVAISIILYPMGRRAAPAEQTPPRDGA